MANSANLIPSRDASSNGPNASKDESAPPATAESIQDLQKTIAELREENAMLRHNLLRCLFPPETEPPFDPADYKPTTLEELLADLKAVENE